MSGTIALVLLVAAAAADEAGSAARRWLFWLGVLAFLVFAGTALLAARWLIRGLLEARARTRAPAEDTQALRRRAELVSTIAHELKNPLMSIKGLAATGRRLYDSMGDDERKDFFRLIDEEATRMKLIADETSTAMKIDAGVLRYELRPEDVSALVEEVAWRAPMGDHPLTVECEPGVRVPCDRARIAEVLDHALDNAAKYSSPDAPVAVRLRTEKRRAVLEVEDRGPGLDPPRREQAFARFASVRPAGFEEVQGAGLGLYICRAHVLAHGGRISLIEGGEGGTILRIELPTEE